MSEEELSRKRLIQMGGGVVITSTLAGRAASAAAAATGFAQSDSSTAIGVLTAVRGRQGSATTADGSSYAGQIQERRPLRVGDRVVIEKQEDGGYAISPLFVDVAGFVEAVDESAVQIGGARYSIDSSSIVRRLSHKQWVDGGPVAQEARAGTAIEGLGIANLETGDTVLAVAWVR
jgi:hypothetical protein